MVDHCLCRKIFLEKKLEFCDSLTVFNISKKKLLKTKNLENNIKLKNTFDDFRFKKEKVVKSSNKDNFFLNLIKLKISKRSYLYLIYENNMIKKYLKIIKN